MAADETILEEEQEALSDDLQAELEDDMFFGEEDQPGEELTDSEDFLSEEELTDTGADELLEVDVAGDADLEDVLGVADDVLSISIARHLQLQSAAIVIGAQRPEMRLLETNNPVSYTHLTLPTTPYV